MTCAACAARIERALNRLDGVGASVNYATERATVHVRPGAVGPDALVAVVERAGYQAALATAADDEPDDGATARCCAGASSCRPCSACRCWRCR